MCVCFTSGNQNVSIWTVHFTAANVQQSKQRMTKPIQTNNKQRSFFSSINAKCSLLIGQSAKHQKFFYTYKQCHLLHSLQLLLPNCICFSCCSLIASACDHAHPVQSIINTKVVCHYCNPITRTSHFHNAHTKILWSVYLW